MIINEKNSMSASDEMDLLESVTKKIRSRKVTVAVIGLGYVGLPIAREFARAGFKVLSFETDDNTKNSIVR